MAVSTSDKPAFISRQVESGRYFYGNLAPSAGFPLAVACAGYESCSPDYLIERSHFPYLAVELVQRGRWRLTREGGSEMLGPGSVFFYGPGTAYRLEAIDAPVHGKYFVDFAGVGAADLFARHEAQLGRHLPGVSQPERLAQLFDQLLDCAELPEELARPMGLQIGELILMRIRVDARMEQTSRSQSAERYRKARQYMNQHHARLMSVEAVAKGCGMSPAYLSRLFARYAEEGALHYLTRLRMQRAAELLIRHSTNVQETAAALGYEDPFHFSRVFKRVYGCAPRDFVARQQAPRISRDGSQSPGSKS